MGKSRGFSKSSVSGPMQHESTALFRCSLAMHVVKFDSWLNLRGKEFTYWHKEKALHVAWKALLFGLRHGNKEHNERFISRRRRSVSPTISTVFPSQPSPSHHSSKHAFRMWHLQCYSSFSPTTSELLPLRPPALYNYPWSPLFLMHAFLGEQDDVPKFEWLHYASPLVGTLKSWRVSPCPSFPRHSLEAICMFPIVKWVALTRLHEKDLWVSRPFG